MSTGKLYVKVVEARDLPPADRNGLADPYCKVNFGRQKFETVVIRSTLHPVWNEEHVFRYKDKGTNTPSIVVDVYDRDAMKFDDYFGQGTISVPHLTRYVIIDDWYPLHKKGAPTHHLPGEIRIIFRFVPDNPPPSIEAPTPQYVMGMPVSKDPDTPSPSSSSNLVVDAKGHPISGTGSQSGKPLTPSATGAPVLATVASSTPVAQFQFGAPVLISGGQGTSHNPATFNATLTWHWPRIGGALPAARVSHTMTHCGNSLIVYGGASGRTVLGDMHVLAIDTMNWSRPAARGTPPAPRFGHGACIFNKNLYVFGGGDGERINNTFLCYNLRDNTWSTPSANNLGFPSPRVGHSTVLIGAKMFVVGGFSPGYGYMNDVHFFDFVRNLWYNPPIKGTPPHGRVGHSAISNGDKIFIFGGSAGGRAFQDVWVLDTFRYEWTHCVCTGLVPTARFNHTAVLLGSKMLVVGGDDQRSQRNDVYALDIATMTWSHPDTQGSPPLGRSRHTLAAIGSRLFLFGGAAGDTYFNDTVVATFA